MIRIEEQIWMFPKEKTTSNDYVYHKESHHVVPCTKAPILFFLTEYKTKTKRMQE